MSCLPVYAAPCLWGQCKLLHLSPSNWKCFNAYNYIHACKAMTLNMHQQGRFNNHRIMDMTTRVVGLMNIGNIVPREGTGNRTDISGTPGQCATITPCTLPWCHHRTHANSLPQRSVQTTTILTNLIYLSKNVTEMKNYRAGNGDIGSNHLG